MSRRPARPLSAEERALWRDVTRSVKPRRGASPEAEGPPGEKPAPVPVPAPPAQKASPAKPKAPPPPPPPPLAPLGRRHRQRLARGRETVDARIDLHGRTAAEAHDVLLRFLRRAQGEGAKLVLVITGKGARGADSFSERGVLRRQVPQWLALAEFRTLVVGFEDAHAAHGGEGALYVRIRRAGRAR